jgi:hypothetical protein
VTRRTDPETYLRLAWERIVLSDEHRRGSNDTNAVSAASRVLVAARGISAERVAAIDEEYQDALLLRLGNMRHFFFPRLASQRRIELSVQRVVLLSADFVTGSAQMTLTQVVFTDDSTMLDISGTDEKGTSPALLRRPGVMGFGRQIGGPLNGLVLTIRDDAGTVASASMPRSSSNGRNWEAQFKSDVPLAATTKWLEIDGRRVDLPDPGPTPQVRIERLDADSSLHRALRREVVNDIQMRGPASLEFAITALVETGTLAADDPMLEEAQQISAAVMGHQPLPGLPEPWSSLQRRSQKSDGPVGRLPIGVAVSVGGTSIRFDSLLSEPHAFSVALAVSPGEALLRHGPRPYLGLPPIEWWAEDDRGNVYLSASGNGGGSDNLAEGILQSRAPIDPLASELRLVPTGQDERAIVTLSLASLAPL